MIELRPSSIVIHDYEDGTSNKLERGLSIWNPNWFRVDWSAMLRDSDKMIIPGGYDIRSLRSLLPGRKIVDLRQKVSFPSRKVKFKCKGNPRDLKQQNSVNFLLGETDYFSYAAGKTQKMLNLETGGGKTFVSIYFAAKFGRATIIVVDQDQFVRQWTNEILSHTDLKEEDIGIIAGVDNLKKIQKDPKAHKIYIASHRTLSSYGKENPWLIQRLFQKLGIGLKIYDEAHVEWKSIFTIDSVTDTEMTVYLTATPARSNPIEDEVYQRIFQGVVRYGRETEREEDNYHKVVYVTFNSKPPANKEIELKTPYGFDVNGWYHYMMADRYDQFIEILQTIIKMVEDGSKKTLKKAIVMHTLDSVQKVYDTLKELYPDKTVGNYSTLVKNKEERDLELENELIVTTDKSLGKGMNVMDLAVLINTMPLSSPVLTKQMLGRLRKVKGKPTIFFDLTDTGFEACRRQKKSRKETLDAKAKSTFELKL